MNAHRFQRYRPWFLAAAIYNLCWGVIVVALPALFLDLLRIERPSVIALWQVVGMMVLVFAPAYWWASRDPWAHRHLILIGTVGKFLGVLGFLVATSLGQLPWTFGVLVLFNDIVWLPGFALFVAEVGRTTGWTRLLSGD